MLCIPDRTAVAFMYSITLLQILMGLSSGVHIECPQLEVIPVKAFRLEPDMSEKDCGHITVDGECVDYGPIQAEIFPRMISVMSR